MKKEMEFSFITGFWLGRIWIEDEKRYHHFDGEQLKTKDEAKSFAKKKGFKAVFVRY